MCATGCNEPYLYYLGEFVLVWCIMVMKCAFGWLSGIDWSDRSAPDRAKFFSVLIDLIYFVICITCSIVAGTHTLFAPHGY